MNKKAETGIGTLIIFIAMLIVAGITANVFIQSATSLQNQALKTGKQAKESVSTFAQVMGVVATDGSNGDIEDFELELKLSPGSSSINLDNSVLTMDRADGSTNYVFTNGSCINNATIGYYTNTTEHNGTFTVEYLAQGSNYKSGYLQRGDMIKLCFASEGSIGEDNELELRFIPQVGITTTVSFMTDEVMITKLVRLYP